MLARALTLTLALWTWTAASGCIAVDMLVVRQPLIRLEWRMVGDSPDRIDLGWRAGYGPPENAEVLDFNYVFTTMTGSLSIDGSAFPATCTYHFVYLDRRLLTSDGSPVMSLGMDSPRDALDWMFDKSAELGDLDCSVLLFTEEVDSAGGEIGYALRAISFDERPLGSVVLPPEPKPYETRDWKAAGRVPLYVAFETFRLAIIVVLSFGLVGMVTAGG